MAGLTAPRAPFIFLNGEFAMNTEKTPLVFWFSDPVRPDETLVVAGEDFADGAVIEFNDHEDRWISAEPLQATRQSLKAVVPTSLEYGVWQCRVRQGTMVSRIFVVNAPDVWWKQGEGGLDACLAGGWLRLFGKCLNLRDQSKLRVGQIEIACAESDAFALAAALPADFGPGVYPLEVFNGGAWAGAGQVTVGPRPADTRPVLDIMNYPTIDPTGQRDCTLAFVQAMEFARCLGGAIIQVPRGRFRIDGILRPSVYMDSQLFVPENTTLRGAGANLTSLWWPDKKTALPVLIEGGSNFAIENLALYAQGPLHGVIKGDSNVSIENVVIRANSYYMLCPIGGENRNGAHHGRSLPPPDQRGGPGIELWGRNNRILNCDIVSAMGIVIHGGAGSVVSGNKICAFGQTCIAGADGVVYENNEFTGGMVSGGSNIALFGAHRCRHVYFKGNRSKHLYTGDHECLTLDGHGTAYAGWIRNVKDCHFDLVEKLPPFEGKNSMIQRERATAYIVDGRGAGQYRHLLSYSADGHCVIDRPWDAVPDETSYLVIGAFNGRHLIVDNYAEDCGTLTQLYAPNCECIVARNRGLRTSNLNSLARVIGHPNGERFIRYECSWYNQFLDNEVLAGNSWGGGAVEVDRWIGGEATLLIHGEVRQQSGGGEGGKLYNQQHPEQLRKILKEATPRERNLAPSRCQIVRRHIVHSNSSIRILGLVTDALIEHCRFADSERGIRVDAELDFPFPAELSPSFNWDPAPGAECPVMAFQSPASVLIRHNCFENVAQPYAGHAPEGAWDKGRVTIVGDEGPESCK